MRDTREFVTSCGLPTADEELPANIVEFYSKMRALADISAKEASTLGKWFEATWDKQRKAGWLSYKGTPGLKTGAAAAGIKAPTILELKVGLSALLAEHGNDCFEDSVKEIQALVNSGTVKNSTQVDKLGPANYAIALEVEQQVRKGWSGNSSCKFAVVNLLMSGNDFKAACKQAYEAHKKYKPTDELRSYFRMRDILFEIL